uniref:BTB domain-containing protein n=1 Tax=Setaria italica TaxID=4555 RepID=K3YDU1_SETIT
MIGGHQWRICCYPTGIHDLWYPPTGPEGISVILGLMNNTQKLEQGFNCLVGHHEIERVLDHSDRINISCTITILEDDCIEIPPPLVGRSICTTIVAQAPVDVVFDIALSRAMEALYYGSGVESKSEIISIKEANLDGFSLLIKYACEGSLRQEADLWDTLVNAWPVFLSLADMYCVEWLKFHCASNLWDMVCVEIVTTFL